MKAVTEAKRKKRAPEKWKAKPGRPIRIGQTTIRASRAVVLTIEAVDKIRRERE